MEETEVQNQHSQSDQERIDSLTQSFKPDGKFHWLILEIEGIKQVGVDVSNLGKIIQIAWGGGVGANHSFNLDGLQLLK